MIEQHEIH